MSVFDDIIDKIKEECGRAYDTIRVDKVEQIINEYAQLYSGE